ncbi:MAG: hypothetical protein ACU84Q_01455 [Gammaproteobacteria bacterium]
MEMSVPELYQTFYAILETVDRILEFWISASFAIVVAIFLGAERLNKTMFFLISIAYSLVTANMFVRTWINASKFVEIRTLLIDKGEIFDASLSTLAWLLQLGVMTFGTFGTLFFVWYMYRHNNSPLIKPMETDA